MSYLIKRRNSPEYINQVKGRAYWVQREMDAFPFSSYQKASNYVTHNLVHLFPNLSATDVRIVDTRYNEDEERIGLPEERELTDIGLEPGESDTQEVETPPISEPTTETIPAFQEPPVTQQDVEAYMEHINSWLSDMSAISKEIMLVRDFYRREVGICDKETVDILHKIEFSHENVVGGYRLYKQLQDVRLRRRKAKDGIFYMVGLYNSKGELILEKLDKSLKKCRHGMDGRIYTPRVLTNLFESPTPEQDDDTEEAS